MSRHRLINAVKPSSPGAAAGAMTKGGGGGMSLKFNYGSKMERNKIICMLVLKGYTLKQVASVYGVCQGRIRQITCHVGRTVVRIENIDIQSITLTNLRKHKYRIIEGIKKL